MLGDATEVAQNAAHFTNGTNQLTPDWQPSPKHGRSCLPRSGWNPGDDRGGEVKTGRTVCRVWKAGVGHLAGR
jgi:hypothetical protein